MEPKLYINFGFWQAINSKREDGYYNRQIEHCIRQLGGKKSLYSDVYYDPDEFWSLYNKPAYDALKEKYDANGIFSNLYEKCVERR